MRAGVARISKKEWYRRGGFANPALFRQADSRGYWMYFIDLNRGD